MLLLSKNEYIYCFKDENKEKDIQEKLNYDEISIISNVITLEEEINQNKTIHTTDKDVYNIEQIIENINNRNNDLKDPNYFLTGINSDNFKYMKEIDSLFTNINLSNLLDASKEGYFIYNKHIGLTFTLLGYFHEEKVLTSNQKKYFYMNIERILNIYSKDYLKLTLIYYLGNLFNDSTTFKKFVVKISYLFKTELRDFTLLFKIIEKFIEFIKEEKIEDNFYFIFDNIYIKYSFNELKKIKTKYKHEANIHFYFFVQLNSDTVDFLFVDGFNFINDENKVKPIKSRSDLDNIMRIQQLKNLENYYNAVVSRYTDLDKFILLLKIKYISLTESCPSKEDIKNILEHFSDYFKIYCKNVRDNIIVERIDFINDVVRDFFTSTYNANLCNFLHKNDLGIFNEIINNAVEGILLEKDIIFQLISSLFLKKLKIIKIYCYYENEGILDFELNQNTIIIQEQENAPLYDIGVIIFVNGKIILKIYQIGINKEKSELDKLDKDIITFDLIYFTNKIEKIYNIKIDEIYFGIITTKEGYIRNYGENKNTEKLNINLEKRYKNYKTMKKFCYDNRFEFLVFDKSNKTFSIHSDNNILTPVNFTEYINEEFLINPKSYQFYNILNIKKIYFNKNDNLINEINNIIGECNKCKILGKFQTSTNDIPGIKGKDLYIFWEDMNIGKICYFNEVNIYCATTKKKDISFQGKTFIACLIENYKQKNDKNIVGTYYDK